jgi:hypothetical protein
MAVKTPDANSFFVNVTGSVKQEFTTFASVANGDTYVSSLATIIGWSCDASTATPTIALTRVGGTVTFAVGSGPALILSLVLWGF